MRGGEYMAADGIRAEFGPSGSSAGVDQTAPPMPLRSVDQTAPPMPINSISVHLDCAKGHTHRVYEPVQLVADKVTALARTTWGAVTGNVYVRVRIQLGVEAPRKAKFLVPWDDASRVDDWIRETCADLPALPPLPHAAPGPATRPGTRLCRHCPLAWAHRGLCETAVLGKRKRHDVARFGHFASVVDLDAADPEEEVVLPLPGGGEYRVVPRRDPAQATPAPAQATPGPPQVAPAPAPGPAQAAPGPPRDRPEAAPRPVQFTSALSRTEMAVLDSMTFLSQLQADKFEHDVVAAKEAASKAVAGAMRAFAAVLHDAAGA